MPPEPPEPNSGDEYEDDDPQPEEQASGDEEEDDTEDPDALAQRVQQEALEEWDSKTPRERLQFYYSLGSVEHGSPQRQWEIEQIQEAFRDWGVLDARDASEDEEDDEADEEDDDHQKGSRAPVRNPRDRARAWKLPYGKRCWKIPPDAVEFQDDDFDYLVVDDGAELGHLLPAKSLPPWQQAGIMPRSVVKLRGTTANGERKQGLYTAIRVQNTTAPTDDDDLLRPIHKPVCTKAIEQWRKDLSKEDLEKYAVVMNYAPPEEPLNPGEMVGWTKIAPKDMPTSALIAKVPTKRNFADGRHNGGSNGASKKGQKQAQLPFRQHAEQNGDADEEDEDDEPLSKRSSSEAFQNGNGSHAPPNKRGRYSRVNQQDESSDDEGVQRPDDAEEEEDYLGDEEEEEDPPPAAPGDKDDDAFAEEESGDEDDVAPRANGAAPAAAAPGQHNVTIPAAYFAKLVNHYYAHNPNGVP